MDTQSQPIENVSSSTWKYVKAKYVPHFIAILILSLVAIYFTHNILVGIVIMVAICAIGYSIVFNKIKRQFTQEFGESIGFSYEKNTGLETVSGKLFRTGHSQSLYDVLSGTYQNIPMRIFSFRFTIGSGKNSHTYNYTVFEATLAGTVPDILLFSKAHMNEVSDWFSGDETVELEGDFNKYFRLRVPKGYEQEIYQIFAPDVMADLMDKARDVSFEFNGNKLYIYATKIIMKREEMQSIFALSEYLVGLFEKDTSNIHAEEVLK